MVLPEKSISLDRIFNVTSRLTEIWKFGSYLSWRENTVFEQEKTNDRKSNCKQLSCISLLVLEPLSVTA